MLRDFIFSAGGFKFLESYKNKFDCSFRIEEPSGSAVILDVGDQSYRINDNEPLEDFKAAVEKSIETGKNLLVIRYKDSKIEYEEDVDY